MLTKPKSKSAERMNVFSLKQLYNNEIPEEMQFIFIDDEAADYDLLGRSKIITQITNTVANCNNNFGFTIALKGEWGSGKTTILNIAKKQLYDNSIVIVDCFNPWAYSDEETLLVALFDTIMQSISHGFSISEINKFKKIYLKTITANIGYSVNALFESNLNIDRIKKIINNHLESNDKKIVLILDNLERCTSKQVLLILKMIHNLFDFKRVIYILSYDEIVMRKLLKSEHDVEYSFLEKIIQMEFTLPKIDKAILQNVIDACLSNYIKHSSFKVDENERREICKIISNTISNLRDFKRIINSTFSTNFHNRQDLNNIDAILIEIIFLNNPELGNEIEMQSKFFISEDRYVYENEYIYNSEKYNISTTKYFNDLFRKNKYNVKEYESILSHLFPNVKQYLDENRYNEKEKVEFISEHQSHTDRKKYKASIIDKRIYNGKYFNLYFNKSENEFTRINSKIKEFLSFVNYDSDPIKLNEKYLEMEKVYPGWEEKYTMETFQLYLEKIHTEKLLPLLSIIYSFYYKVDNSPLFLQLNAQERIQIIIADLIILLSDNDFTKFIGKIKEDYQNLFLIRKITYWLNPDNRRDEPINAYRYEKIKNLYDSMADKIKTEDINMYSKQYYNRHNVILLVEDEGYASNIKQKLNKHNLLLFVSDFISVSTGSNGIGYTVNTEDLDKYYGWNKLRKDIKTCPESKLKKFLINVIEQSDESIEKSYYTDTYVDIDNLITEHLNR